MVSNWYSVLKSLTKIFLLHLIYLLIAHVCVWTCICHSTLVEVTQFARVSSSGEPQVVRFEGRPSYPLAISPTLNLPVLSLLSGFISTIVKMWTGVSFLFFRKADDYIARPVPAGLLAYNKWISFSMCFCQVRSYRGRAYWMYFWSSWISWRFWHEEGKQRMDFESRALSMLCKCSTTELHPSASLTGSYKTIIFGIQNYMVYSLLWPLGVVLVIP